MPYVIRRLDGRTDGHGMPRVLERGGPDDVSVQMPRPSDPRRELDAHRLPPGGATDSHLGGGGGSRNRAIELLPI